MPDFAIRNLSVLSFAQGFTLWHVKHPGMLAEALAPGYLNPAADMIAPRDMILISAFDGGAQVFVHGSGANEQVVVEPMCSTVSPVKAAP
jgi:hypothetical protein